MNDKSEETELLEAIKFRLDVIHIRLKWIAIWLFLIVCGVGQGVL